MAKLRPLPQRRVIEILVNNGFKETRSAKHTTFKKTTSTGSVLTTWVPHHKEITRFVIGYIIKQTKKPREEFE